MSREDRDALKRRLIAENPEVAASLGLELVSEAVAETREYATTRDRVGVQAGDAATCTRTPSRQSSVTGPLRGLGARNSVAIHQPPE